MDECCLQICMYTISWVPLLSLFDSTDCTTSEHKHPTFKNINQLFVMIKKWDIWTNQIAPKSCIFIIWKSMKQCNGSNNSCSNEIRTYTYTCQFITNLRTKQRSDLEHYPMIDPPPTKLLHHQSVTNSTFSDRFLKQNVYKEISFHKNFQQKNVKNEQDTTIPAWIQIN